MAFARFSTVCSHMWLSCFRVLSSSDGEFFPQGSSVFPSPSWFYHSQPFQVPIRRVDPKTLAKKLLKSFVDLCFELNKFHLTTKNYIYVFFDLAVAYQPYFCLLRDAFLVTCVMGDHFNLVTILYMFLLSTDCKVFSL